MPHNPAHAADFRHYTARRQKALKHIREFRCYMEQLEKVVKAMPANAADAGYMDLDNIEQLAADLEQAAAEVCDWDSLGLECSRVG